MFYIHDGNHGFITTCYEAEWMNYFLLTHLEHFSAERARPHDHMKD